MNNEKARRRMDGTLVTGKTRELCAQIDQHEGPKASDVPARLAAQTSTRCGAEPEMGAPVNGLREAVVIWHSAAKTKAGAMPDLYVAVQNVSEAPIRLNGHPCGTAARKLYIKIDGKTVRELGARTQTERCLLQLARLRLCSCMPPEPLTDGNSTGSIIAEGVLKDTHQSLVAHLLIEKAPPRGWTGKLVTARRVDPWRRASPSRRTKRRQALYKAWQHNARKNQISPAVHRSAGEKLKEFIPRHSATHRARRTREDGGSCRLRCLA